MADTARDRAEAELRRDPARSNAIIAAAAQCTPQATCRWRHVLERAGVIEAIPPADRASITRTWQPRPPRLAIEQGAVTTAEVMALSGASYGAAWRALSRARRYSQPADAAAATDALSVIRTPAVPRAGRYRVGSTPPQGYYRAPDAIEQACAFCTLEYRDGAFTHERSCIAAGRR